MTTKLEEARLLFGFSFKFCFTSRPSSPASDFFPLSLIGQFSSLIHGVISILSYVAKNDHIVVPFLHQPWWPTSLQTLTTPPSSHSHTRPCKGGFSMYSHIQSLLLLLPSAATPEVRVLVRFQLGSCFNDNFLFTVSTIEHRFDFKVLLLNSQLRVPQGKQAPAGESQA